MRLLKVNMLITGILMVGVLSLQILMTNTPIKSAPVVMITSPSAGQAIQGTEFTASGTATPNSTVILSSGGSSFLQTKSDGSGNWSAVVSSLPAGDTTLTAKVIENPEYGYFITTSGGADSSIHRIRLSDNVIDPNGGGWPIVSNNTLPFIFSASPTQPLFMTSNPLSSAIAPAKFTPADVTEPSLTANYPNNAGATVGAFSADGSKYYSPNRDLSHVSIIDVATNTRLTDVVTANPPSLVTRGSNDKVYVVSGGNTIEIINPATDTTESTFQVPCASNDSATQSSFSSDANYEYYFVTCASDSNVLKLRISDNSLVSTYELETNDQPVTAALSPDNKRLFVTSLIGSTNADKMRVIDLTEESLQTVQLSAGAIGIFPSADFQSVYVSTPGGFDTFNIDIVDTQTLAVTQVATPNIPSIVATLPTESSSTTVDVSFVLGAQAASAPSGELAKTGLLIALATPLGLFLILGALYTYYDYQRHKTPLKEAMSDVDYTYIHHLKVVTVPLAKYRLSIGVGRSEGGKLKGIRKI